MNRYIEWQKHPPTHEPSPAQAFFSETLPEFFTVDIPQGFARFDQALSPLGRFTTIDVPQFFTTTVPAGLESMGEGIREFGSTVGRAGKIAIWIFLALAAVLAIKGLEWIFK